VSGELVVPLNVDVQNALDQTTNDLPMHDQQFDMWANLAYSNANKVSQGSDAQVTIRLVEEVEMVQLNNEFRGKNKPTNVLSFPVEQDFFDLTQLTSNDEAFDEYNLLGDIVICHSVIVKEASEQAKSTADHYAHMVVHGILHLCGYDHIDDSDAQEMESLEVVILAKHNVANPYS